MSTKAHEIRDEFIRFFIEKHGHTNVPSSSLLPADDPTLLFANAGMNQYKPIFLGHETRDYTRAANTQKCIRAGGKHNDLEDVGRDCYHHTFFEMLGNWSFGDYFKAEAIDWAWDLLTNVWGLDPSRLHATYFEGDAADGLEPDTEARDLWGKRLPEDHIHPGNKKDNFWEMGETGPCGPCSEIHYDATPDGDGGGKVNQDDPLVIEIWNLVFIQFNRLADGSLEPLPAHHVDTGMGLERVVRVIQGKKSNYATDLFVPILEAIETMTSHRYGPGAGKGEDRFDTMDETCVGDVAMRVIADHARAAVFAITDGILPSNDGRGSVLRAILRRAAGFGREHLKIEGPFLCRLAPVIVEQFAGAFPELSDRADYVAGVIRDEEESFGKTLDRGLQLLDREMDRLRAAGETTISGATCFELHATYGFPFTLTKLMAEKAGLAVDEAGFAREMDEHRKASQGGGEKFKADAIVGLPATDDKAKYDGGPTEATVLGWVVDNKFTSEGTLAEGAEAAVVLDATCFYGEQGGQVGDTGRLVGDGVEFDVTDTKVAGQSVLHVGKVVSGSLAVGQTVTCEVSSARMDTMRNHSATHLLNFALREVLGGDVHQQGSEVSPERLRFDFSHSKAMTNEQLAETERIVNRMVLADGPVTAELQPLADAKKIPGVRAMFGEKYPDPVRVVVMDTSVGRTVEFCGGTHLQRTGQVGLLKILSEESVAKGVRRITAVTGTAAMDWVARADAILKETGAALKTAVEEIPSRVEAMQQEIKKLRKRPAAAPAGEAATDTSEVDAPFGKAVIARSSVCDAGAMRNFCDQQRQKGAAAVFVGATDGEKVMLVAMVDDAVAKSGAIKAGDWVKAVAPVVGGGGGGKPTMAQAGGKQPEKLPEALEAAKAFALKT